MTLGYSAFGFWRGTLALPQRLAEGKIEEREVSGYLGNLFKLGRAKSREPTCCAGWTMAAFCWSLTSKHKHTVNRVQLCCRPQEIHRCFSNTRRFWRPQLPSSCLSSLPLFFSSSLSLILSRNPPNHYQLFQFFSRTVPFAKCFYWVEAIGWTSLVGVFFSKIIPSKQMILSRTHSLLCQWQVAFPNA